MLGTTRLVKVGIRYVFRNRTDCWVETIGPQNFVAWYAGKRVCSFAYVGDAIGCIRQRARAEKVSRGHG
jgi:hypothetical protein